MARASSSENDPDPTASTPADEPGPDGDWLRTRYGLREVVGLAEAVDILTDPRMHADFLGVVEGVAVTSGPLRQILSTSLLSLNGEEHRRLRAVAAPYLTPRAADALRPFARRVAHELLDREAGTLEFVEEFAAPYVIANTCHFIGIPREYFADYRAAVARIAFATEDLPNRVEEFASGVVELAEYAVALLRARRSDGMADFLSGISDAVERGEISELAGAGLVVALLSAGFEPTVNQLAITVAELGTRPESWERLVAGACSAVNVVEGILRLRSTNQAVIRRAAEDLTYRNVRVRSGQLLSVGLAAANHDARHFRDPDALDVETKLGDHIAFGFGPHFCLGAALARVQLQEAVAALTSRFDCPRIIDIEEREGMGLLGPSKLRLALRPARPRTRG